MANTFYAPSSLSSPFGYQIGWTDYGSGYSPVKYVKDNSGYVRMIGLTSRPGVGSVGEVIFFLPPGHKPAAGQILQFMCNGDSGMVYVAVDTYSMDAGVRFMSGTAWNYLSLCNVHFLAEA